jgi:hypothetical protein
MVVLIKKIIKRLPFGEKLWGLLAIVKCDFMGFVITIKNIFTSFGKVWMAHVKCCVETLGWRR